MNHDRSGNQRTTSPVYRILLATLALGFCGTFAVIVIPELVRDGGDILGGFGAGFVNPYSTGFSLDVIFCWAVLLVWIIWERVGLGVRYGWICLALGLVPGVATGFATYLLLRHHQITPQRA